MPLADKMCYLVKAAVGNFGVNINDFSFKIQMQTETILLIPKTESPFEMSKVV